MTIFKAIHAFFLAATSFLKVWPIVEQRKLYRQIERYEDQIYELGLSGPDPADKLRIEILAARKRRATKQISDLRSTLNHPS